MTTSTIHLPFTHDEAIEAYQQWGCNCGPSALAAITNRTLAEIRPVVEYVGFAERRYMSPTMMRDALRLLAFTVTYNGLEGLCESLKFARHGLVRIQWEGPWTAPGANPRWAYRYTHWITSWMLPADSVAGAVLSVLDPVVFDVNGGLMGFERWEEEIVPAIVATIPRADGDWHVTHSWEVEKMT